MRKIRQGTLAILLSVSLIVAGCGASWISTALADLPILVQMAQNIAAIVALAQGAPQNSGVAAEITNVAATAKTGLEAIQALVTSYHSAPAAQKSTVLGEMDTAIASVQANLQQILAAAKVLDPKTQATITGIVTLALGTLLAIQTLVPSPAGKLSAVAPIKPPTPAQLQAAENAILRSGGFGQLVSAPPASHFPKLRF